MEVAKENTNNANVQKKNVRIAVTTSNLGKLIELTQLMTWEAQSAFRRAYGQILDLLLISVEAPVLSALSQFWNSSIRVFELPKLDIVPTIEEYSVMIRLPMKEAGNIYFYHGSYVSEEKIAKLIGTSMSQMAMETRGSTRGIKKTFFESHLQILAQQKEWSLFNKTLALAIYGLVLFPFTPDVVDQAAMDVFYKYDTRNMNPIPAILADTFLSIDVCNQKKGGRLRCCSHMLYVWFMTHVYAGSCMGFVPNPLKDFHRIPVRRQEVIAWKEEIASIEPSKFSWICPWYHGESFIASCGEIPNVPLMGPRGCISYTPTLVLRQLGQFQAVPKKNSMGGYNHLYQNEDTRQIEDKIKRAWKNVKIQKTNRLTTHSHEYKTWRDNRIKGISVSTNPLPKSYCSQSQEACSLASELEVAKAQASFLKEKKESAETEILILQSRCQKMAKEIENLKDECADVAERSVKEKAKVTSAFLAEIKDLKEKLCVRERQLKEMSSSKQELRFKMQMKVHQNEEVIQKLKIEACEERESRKILEQEVENLSALLARREKECLQGWESSDRYRSMLIDTTEYGHFWRREALEKSEEVEELKRKCAHASESITNFIPSFVNQFEKAKEQVDMIPVFGMPNELVAFMDSCESVVKRFRKKKMRLLTH